MLDKKLGYAIFKSQCADAANILQREMSFRSDCENEAFLIYSKKKKKLKACALCTQRFYFLSSLLAAVGKKSDVPVYTNIF